jgi:drug/metabolite transporter (DMT)-like permease
MFVGEFACLGIYALKKAWNRNEESLDPTKAYKMVNPLKLFIPALFDVIASTMSFVALVQCSASVYQMMRGTIVVMTAGLSVVFLKKKQFFHHQISLFSIVIGVFIAGMASVNGDPND